MFKANYDIITNKVYLPGYENRMFPAIMIEKTISFHIIKINSFIFRGLEHMFVLKIHGNITYNN